MRQLQKGDQGPRQRDHRRIRLASVLILRTLRKANHRVPQETQASSAQDDRIAAPSDSSRNKGSRLTGFSFSSPFPTAESPPPLELSKFQKPAILGWQILLYLPPALYLPARQAVRALVATPAYERSRRARYKIEALFAELKRRMRLGSLTLTSVPPPDKGQRACDGIRRHRSCHRAS